MQNGTAILPAITLHGIPVKLVGGSADNTDGCIVMSGYTFTKLEQVIGAIKVSTDLDGNA